MPRLVLTRNEGQSIDVVLPDGRQFAIMVSAITRSAKLVFEAPADVRILRSELGAPRAAEHQAESTISTE